MKGLWPLVKRWLTSRAPYVGVALCIVVIACVIDALRGKATELFNAWGVVVAVANKVGIGLTPPAKQFIYAQDKLGAKKVVVLGAAGRREKRQRKPTG